MNDRVPHNLLEFYTNISTIELALPLTWPLGGLLYLPWISEAYVGKEFMSLSQSFLLWVGQVAQNHQFLELGGFPFFNHLVLLFVGG